MKKYMLILFASIAISAMGTTSLQAQQGAPQCIAIPSGGGIIKGFAESYKNYSNSTGGVAGRFCQGWGAATCIFNNLDVTDQIRCNDGTTKIILSGDATSEKAICLEGPPTSTTAPRP